MQLEDLLEVYQFNKLSYTSIEKEENSNVVVIKFGSQISVVCYCDDDFVFNSKIIANFSSSSDAEKISDAIKTLCIIAITIDALSSITPKERNIILETLGMYDGSFVNGKKIKNNKNKYQVEVINNLLVFSIGKKLV